jgi:peptidyl carrier protein
MTQAETKEKLLAFIKERFLAGDQTGGLDGDTPLLSWGILNSLNTAELVAFIGREFNYAVPQSSVNMQNFQTVNNISTMISDAPAGAKSPDG